MSWKIVPLLVLAVTSFVQCQNAPKPKLDEGATVESCKLNEEDYSVYAAVLDNLGGPEDPEEAWEGKDFLLVDLTETDMLEKGEGQAGWGFRSSSKAAPGKRTFADLQAKAKGGCRLRSTFGEQRHITVIASDDVEKFFKKDGGWWGAFYKEHPKAGGFWAFSRPGYSPAHDESLVYVRHSCGGLCGTGHLYLLAKENGQWKVKNRLMLWIS
jgi:hypothetical protein